MGYEVLVVDDNLSAAKEFARLIAVKADLRVIETDDPEEAISLVRENSIKVVLLDQRMPKKDGTKLFIDLKKIDPLLKAIMVTGEASAQELANAHDLGFVDYIHKSNVAKIIPCVLQHYCAYHTDVAENNTFPDTPLYSYTQGIFWHKTIISYHLISAEVTTEEHIYNNWKTIVTVNAGEQITSTITRQNVSRLIFESEEKDKLLASLSAKTPIIKGLTAKLETVIEDRFKETSFKETTASSIVEKIYKLSEEPKDPNMIHVKSRVYEQSPVYRIIRLVIKKECSACDSKEIFSVNISYLTESIATRQIDYLSDGTQKIIDTGSVSY